MADTSGSQGSKATHHVIATSHAVIFTLTEDHHQKARACIAKSGKATFTFHEVSVGELPRTLLGDGVSVD